ncbi:AbiH family protein [Prevotella sp.]|uniref:AbiH family protein n=1 Tax=Prevotella sp. TaxID=59823 RepID=UPI003DA5563E
MNRLILIGNGFDLAHGLKTSYKDFIEWYWNKVFYELSLCSGKVWSDQFCTFTLKRNDQSWSNYMFYHISIISPPNGLEVIGQILNDKENFEVKFSRLFDKIIKSIETKGWVDIENDYYSLLYTPSLLQKQIYPKELNKQLDYIKRLLSDYLLYIQQKALAKSIINKELKEKIFAPIKPCELVVGAKESLSLFVNNRLNDPDFSIKDLYERWDKEWNFTINSEQSKQIKQFKESLNYIGIDEFADEEIPDNFLFPYNMKLLNFNYTEIADQYIKDSVFEVNHIHGDLNNVEGMIFGYGDELDENYKKIQNINDNEYLKNSKSVRYLEADNYRNMLNFIESGPYQIYIMGHSCGNSDRTLLNTLFEHENCISIKPFYYKTDDKSDTYLEIVQNISRNFTNMKLMRDRVVNKKYCEALPQVTIKQ